eukprot:434612_1
MGNVLGTSIVNKSNGTKQCHHKSIENCCVLQRFVKIMHRYSDVATTKKCVDFDIDNSGLLTILNDYLHLMHSNKKDEEFDFIVNLIGYCDVTSCNAFIRNYRDRTAYNTEHNSKIQILDKIHCHFMHCYDIGNRLSPEESRSMSNDETLDNKDDESKSFQAYSTNAKIINLNKMLKAKHKVMKKNVVSLIKRRYPKFNQLLFEECKSKQSDINGDITCNMYNFGYKFYYGYSGEGIQHYDYVSVSPLYGSIKEELLSNKICIISIEQFVSERKKAQIHLQSLFCKKTFP